MNQTLIFHLFHIKISFIFITQFVYKIMLTDTDIFLCSQFNTQIFPISQKKKLNGIPKNIQRISHDRIILCDPNIETKKTKLIQMKIKRKNDTDQKLIIEQERIIQQFDGVFTSWDFQYDNYALLLNREGDFLFYNLYNKSTHEAEKQHPGLYFDAEIMHTNEHFVTCGGSFKNQNTNAPERIIKVWQIDSNDCLIQKSRINTGHKKSIEHSFLLNKSSVVSFSSDKSLRLTNLTTEQVSCIIRTEVELLSGCQIDYNTILAGGNSKMISLYDIRSKKALNICPMINQNLVHIVNFTRFTDKNILVSNINEIHSIDLRTWKIANLGVYKQGQINSQILTLNNRQFIIGNREKTLQVWRAA